MFLQKSFKFTFHSGYFFIEAIGGDPKGERGGHGAIFFEDGLKEAT